MDNTKKYRLSNEAFGLLMMMPAVILLIIVVALPIGKSIYTSFCDYKISNLNNPVWNNFQNYKDLFKDGKFWGYLSTTLIYVFFSVLLQTVMGFGIALLLNSKIKGRTSLRGAFMIPWVIPSIVIAILWKLMLNEQFGAINYLLFKIGIFDTVNVSWTMNPKLAMLAIIFASSWREIPYMMIMILAGLQSVDNTLIESAMVEGANAWQRLIHVIIPSIMPVLMTSVWIAVLSAFQMFTIIYNLTGGGPGETTYTLSIAAYKTAFVSYDFGKGSALGVLWLLLLLVATVFFNKLKNKSTSNYQ